ncbi:MAG: response regulator transcription factor [Xanthomonadales bacterium]|nr:response regulator transcription factor [Xanthomonadales bacterium]
MNILIVDDHPIVRQGIRHLLSAQIDHARVTEAGSTAEALRKAGEVAPDVCVIDLSLGKESGLDLLRMLREAGFDSPTLVLSVFDESLHAERALRAGARGYMMKESAPDKLVDAVRRVARGEVVVSPTVQARLLKSMLGGGSERRSGESALSVREREVLELLGDGFSSQQIADRMARSVKTIETHRSNIQRKLNLNSALQLVRYATLRSRR